jgi:hypothetical protein
LPTDHAGVKGRYHHEEDYPFYKFIPVFTSGKRTSKFPLTFKSENPAEISFLSNAMYIVPTPAYSPSCHVSINRFSYYEMKNKPYIGRYFEIRKFFRVL